MKKRLYDFKTSTAIIVMGAYIVLGIFLAFSIIRSDGFPWGSLLVSSLLLSSLVWLLIRYVFQCVKVDENSVCFRSVEIPKSEVHAFIAYNERFRLFEIVLHDRRIDYKHSKTEDAPEIRLEETKPNRKFLEQYCGIEDKVIRRKKNKKKKR